MQDDQSPMAPGEDLSSKMRSLKIRTSSDAAGEPEQKHRSRKGSGSGSKKHKRNQ